MTAACAAAMAVTAGVVMLVVAALVAVARSGPDRRTRQARLHKYANTADVETARGDD